MFVPISAQIVLRSTNALFVLPIYVCVIGPFSLSQCVIRPFSRPQCVTFLLTFPVCYAPAHVLFVLRPC